jgi:hypothetical protein
MTTVITSVILGWFAVPAFATPPITLLVDEFDGIGTKVSSELWAMPADDDGSFFGQTKLKVSDAQRPLQNSGVATLIMDTHYADDPGNAFWGHEIRSKERFGGGGGVSYTWRGAYNLANSHPDFQAGGGTTLGGAVAAGFAFGTQAFDGGGNITRDEIDVELLLNEQNSIGAGNGRVLTNVYNNANFVGDVGGLAFQSPGTDMTVIRDYEMRQLRDRIEWYQDGALIRTETGSVPKDPVEFRLNTWVPDSGFTTAYDASLTPDALLVNNRELHFDVDRVEIKELGAVFDANVSKTRRTALNLADHSFTAGTPTQQEFNPPTFTGGWTSFNNFFPDGTPSIDGNFGGGAPDFSFDGDDAAALVYGSFFGADGVLWQRVEEAPGQTFDGNVLEAKINVYTESTNSIADTTNVLITLLRFYDAANNEITDPNDPGNGALNSTVVVNLSGYEDLQEDTWITHNVRAKAPAGTQYVEVFPIFVQTQCPGVCDGGAAWLDDIELNLLTDILDTNLDGVVDITDRDFILSGAGDARDVNMDGMIDSNDVSDWNLEFGVVSGDFNSDGFWNCTDIDALVAAIAGGSTDLSFDMNGDGMVTAADVTAENVGWLAVGGANNPADTGGNAFLEGDANLDGTVDGADFLDWNTNKFTATAEWCSGDFTADGTVDGADFLIWNTNKFTSSDLASVPEPATWLVLNCGLLVWLARRRTC